MEKYIKNKQKINKQIKIKQTWFSVTNSASIATKQPDVSSSNVRGVNVIWDWPLPVAKDTSSWNTCLSTGL